MKSGLFYMLRNRLRIKSTNGDNWMYMYVQWICTLKPWHGYNLYHITYYVLVFLQYINIYKLPGEYLVNILVGVTHHQEGHLYFFEYTSFDQEA